MFHLVYLALGSNIEDRRRNLKVAVAGFAPHIKCLRSSPIYETQPWGIQDQPDFLNQVVEVQTQLQVLVLLDFLKRLEVQLGRQHTIRYGPRVIDIDILFYDDLIFNTPGLVVPHPRLHERAFVLAPLAELAPDLKHPILNRKIKDILQECDLSGISVYEP